MAHISIINCLVIIYKNVTENFRKVNKYRGDFLPRPILQLTSRPTPSPWRLLCICLIVARFPFDGTESGRLLFSWRWYLHLAYQSIF